MQTYEVVKEILKENPNRKSPKQIADFLNVHVSTVYRWAEDPTGTSGVTIPTDKIKQLSVFTKDPRLIKYLANGCNLYIVPIPPNHNNGMKSIVKEIAKTLKECSAVISSSSKAIIDGKLTKAEQEEITKECQDALEQMAYFKEVIKRA